MTSTAHLNGATRTRWVGVGHSIERDSSRAGAILDLARSFGLQVIAEGIEVSAQRDRLVRLGCPAGQGFLFARPLAPDDLERLVAARPAAA